MVLLGGEAVVAPEVTAGAGAPDPPDPDPPDPDDSDDPELPEFSDGGAARLSLR